MSTYFENFKSKADIESSYGCTLPADADILVAWYGYGDYSGSSFVLYRSEGKLYEVNGDHCSCYGLEGQWNPEETTVAALKMRPNYRSRANVYRSYDGESEARKKYRAVLDRLEAEGA